MTRPTYGNCFFGLLYLLLRGKAASVFCVSCPEAPSLWKWHFGVLTRRGNCVHFARLGTSREEDPYAPWWFLGAYQVIHRNDLDEELAASGRDVLFVTERVHLATAVALLAAVLLTPLWLLAWGLFPLYWVARNLPGAWRAK